MKNLAGAEVFQHIQYPAAHRASALGAILVVLGTFLTALQGNEAMKWMVLAAAMPEGGTLIADCPAGELAEEGLSVAECEYLVDQARGLILSAPAWFPPAYRSVALAGALAAFFSVLVGGALVNAHPRAAGLALLGLAVLLAFDGAQFAIVVNAGPVIRTMYLSDTALWILIHAVLLTAVVAAGRIEPASADAP